MSQTLETASALKFGPDDVLAVFDGQGTQWEGMGEDVWRRYDAAKQVFKIASEAIGMDMERICWGDNAYLLNDTRIAQPANVTVGLAKYRAWREDNPEPAVVTGLSMGLYPAVGISAVRDSRGEIDTPEVDYRIIEMIIGRSKIMHEVAHDKNGRMMPVIGPRREEIEAAIKGTGAKIGVFLDKTVHTLTGQEHAVASAGQKLSALRAKVSGYLPIQQAAHHELQMETIPPMSDLINSIGIGDPHLKLAANGAFYLENKQQIIDHLLDQMINPAEWQALEEMLILDGIRKVVQFGSEEKRSLARQMTKNGREFGIQSITFPMAA